MLSQYWQTKAQQWNKYQSELQEKLQEQENLWKQQEQEWAPLRGAPAALGFGCSISTDSESFTKKKMKRFCRQTFICLCQSFISHLWVTPVCMFILFKTSNSKSENYIPNYYFSTDKQNTNKTSFL